jgi:hypothetical protein
LLFAACQAPANNRNGLSLSGLKAIGVAPRSLSRRRLSVLSGFCYTIQPNSRAPMVRKLPSRRPIPEVIVTAGLGPYALWRLSPLATGAFFVATVLRRAAHDYRVDYRRHRSRRLGDFWLAPQAPRLTIQPSSRALSLAICQANARNSGWLIGARWSQFGGRYLARSWPEPSGLYEAV